MNKIEKDYFLLFCVKLLILIVMKITYLWSNVFQKILTKHQQLIGNPEELKAIFQKTCLGGYKEIIQLYVEHFDIQDEETGIPQWKDCLFHENHFATSALQSYNKKLKYSHNYDLGKYLSTKFEGNHFSIVQRFYF